jgi:hypothetical protein
MQRTESMSLESLLKRRETRAALVQSLKQSLQGHPEKAVEASVAHAIEEAIDLVGPKVSSWKSTSDTFSDA